MSAVCIVTNKQQEVNRRSSRTTGVGGSVLKGPLMSSQHVFRDLMD